MNNFIQINNNQQPSSSNENSVLGGNVKILLNKPLHIINNGAFVALNPSQGPLDKFYILNHSKDNSIKNSSNDENQCNIGKKEMNKVNIIQKSHQDREIVTTINKSDISENSEDERLVIADFNNIEFNEDCKDDIVEHTLDNNGINVASIIHLQKKILKSPVLNNFELKSAPNNVSRTMNENSVHSNASSESDDYLPIQAEVVMSEGSDEEEINKNIFKSPKSKVKYQSKAIDSFIEYLPSNHDLEECSDLSIWQLNTLNLPQYTPIIEPPTWLKCTIPPNGYVCGSCGDKFNLESSLIEHKERRSIYGTFNCDICQETIIFHNRCAYKEHINKHLLEDKCFISKDTFVKPLPLEQMKLLQPIKIGKYKPSVEKESKQKVNSFLSVKNISNLVNIEENSADITLSGSSVQCYMCKVYFEDKEKMIWHLKTDQSWSDEKVECKKCRLVLPSLCSGKAHILIHSSTSEEPSICPECGQKYNDKSEFVRHLNDCGHQFRKSGIVCPTCNVCFFQYIDDFIRHWIKEHCFKTYNSAVSGYIFTCTICSEKFDMSGKEEREIRIKIKKHLNEKHSSIVNRVHYVFKSKFCSNAFRTKFMLNDHHEKFHKLNNVLVNVNCTLTYQVQSNLRKFFGGIVLRNSFVTLNLNLNLPQVQGPAVILKPSPIPLYSTNRAEKVSKYKLGSQVPYEKLKPVHCYMCGYFYSSMKEFKRHSKICKQSVVSFSCETCKTSVSKEKFPQHCVSHIKEDLYACIYCCGQQFESRKHIEAHFEMHALHQFSYPVTCIFCGFIIREEKSALEHLINKHELNRIQLEHQCVHCDRKFHGYKGLAVHITKCSSAPKLTSSNAAIYKLCNFCKRTINRDVFSKHITTHLEDGHLICCICDGMIFESGMLLLRHLEEHSESLAFPYLCPICQYSMNDSPSCLQHIRDEHGVNNVQCPDCDMSYNYAFKLQRHINIAHKISTFVKRRYICWICRAYDHVKKDSVFKHFKLCHDLEMDEIDEQMDIRTRGFGTLPSDHYVPAKSIGKKESPKSQKRTSREEKKQGICVSSNDNEIDVIIKEEIQEDMFSDELFSQIPEENHKLELNTNSDVISNINRGSIFQNETLSQAKNDYSMKEIKQEICHSEDESPYKRLKIKFVFQNNDEKLANKTKVVIKRIDQSNSNSDNPEEFVEKNKIDNLLIKSIARSSDDKTMKTENIYKSKIIKNKSEDRMKTKYVKKKSENNRSRLQTNNKRIHIVKIKSNKRKLDDNVDRNRKIFKKSKKFECKKCKYSTSNKFKFTKHKASHKEDDSEVEGFYCEECGASFVVKPSLIKHLFFVHRIKGNSQNMSYNSITNNRNSKVVQNKNVNGKVSKNIKRSKSVDAEEKTYTQKYRRISDMGKRERKQFVCNVCKANFTSSSALYEHLSVHSMSFLKMGQTRRSSIK